MNTLKNIKGKTLNFILFSCILTVLYSCNNHSNWFQFTSEEQNFKIKFPEKPIVHETSFLSSGQATIQLDQIEYTHGFQNFQTISYTYSEELIKKASQLDSLFSNFVQSTLFSNKGIILKESTIKISEHPGKEFTIKLKNEEAVKKIRIFLLENNRLQVNMASFYPNDSPKFDQQAEKDAVYFLNSFELINEY